MSSLAPPSSPPRLAMDDDDRLWRLRRRLWQVFATALTVFATAWLCTLGWIPAILSLLVAKHVLVAIFLMGSGVYKPPR